MALEFLGNHENNFYWNSFGELDDHRILEKFFKDFDQNSGDQPYYTTIQMT